ncbi:hypothetical protein CKY51_01565 [Xanthomonas maliensis]|nr:hypothetical protein [Xanthomonas maliensis]KAB7772321.1 hypothetical protein CKY51_01565 [Xanthomonas maliensis]
MRGMAAWATAGLLALLMVCTRGQHLAGIDGLPSASWAVFFLAGALLRPAWVLPLLFALASALDLLGLASGSIGDWCLSPAYWALALAYTALWSGGRVYARRLQHGGWRAAPRLLLAILLSGSAAYLLSKGSFYFFSGRYLEPTVAGFLARMPVHYPRAMLPLLGYVGAVLTILAAARSRSPFSPSGVRA